MAKGDWTERAAEYRRRTNGVAEYAFVRARVEALWRQPRNEAAAAHYLRDTLPSGRYWVSGAGPQGQGVVAALAPRPDIEIAGFVDRRAHLFDCWEGLPVRPVSATGSDRIIVANRIWEPDMIDDLAEARVSPDRVIPVYTAEGFAAFTVPGAAEATLSRAGAVRTIIVRDTSRVGLIPEPALRLAVPAEGTIVVYMSSHANVERSAIYDWIDAEGSLSLTLRLIHRLRPETVHLSTMAQFNDLALALCPPERTWRFVFEPNDLTLVYGDALRGLVPMSREHLDRCRFAETWALRHADLTVTNCVGERWEELKCRLDGRSQPFFSAIDKQPTGDKDLGKSIHVLYAGGIPPAQARDEWKTDYRFLPLLSELAQEDGVVVDVYNAWHTMPEQDSLYLDVMAYNSPTWRYHRAKPFEQILATQYDFGWLHRGDIPRRASGEVGAGNDVLVLNKRFTAYVAAGLPVVIDDQLDAMAELIERFRAGIVLPAGPLDATSVAERLRSVDRAELSAGVARLRLHILSANRKTLDRIACLVSSPPLLPSISQ